MKTIVISGAHSGVGKTTLAGELKSILPDSVFVKIGHHPENPAKQDLFYSRGTSLHEITRDHSAASYLIIESNSILNEYTPDCVIYLVAESPKPSALTARKKADIVQGEKISQEKLNSMTIRLGVDNYTMRRIAWLSGARPSPVTAIILAGGKSSRMGKDKAFLEINGVPIVNHLVSSIQPYFDDVILSTGSGSGAWNDVNTVPDIYQGCGPLSGIHACLSASKTDYNFIIACDIPGVNLPVLFTILSLSDKHEIVTPSFDNNPAEPLFTFYRKHVYLTAGVLLRNGRFSVRELFDKCDTHIRRFTDAHWYRNLNTPEDYRCFVREQYKQSIDAYLAQGELL